MSETPQKGRIIGALDAFFASIEEQPIYWRIILLAVLAVAYFPLFFIIKPHIYLLGDTPVTISGRPEYFFFNNVMFYLHVLTALPPLLIGPWMFHASFRTKHLYWHRKLGEIYIYCCLLSAMTSLPLGLKHFSGLIPSVGFSSLAVTWYIITTIAFSKALQKDFVGHRRWMMRSYACTLAFVNVKIYSFVVLSLGLQPSELTMKVLQSYVSWLGNLTIAEIYLSKTTHTGKRRKNKKKQKNDST